MALRVFWLGWREALGLEAANRAQVNEATAWGQDLPHCCQQNPLRKLWPWRSEQMPLVEKMTLLSPCLVILHHFSVKDAQNNPFSGLGVIAAHS